MPRAGGDGSFALSHSDLSLAIGASTSKDADIAATGARAVVTSCPGCVMQLVDALHQTNALLPVLHTVQPIDVADRAGAAGSRLPDLMGAVEMQALLAVGAGGADGG